MQIGCQLHLEGINVVKRHEMVIIEYLIYELFLNKNPKYPPQKPYGPKDEFRPSERKRENGFSLCGYSRAGSYRISIPPLCVATIYAAKARIFAGFLLVPRCAQRTFARNCVSRAMRIALRDETKPPCRGRHAMMLRTMWYM